MFAACSAVQDMEFDADSGVGMTPGNIRFLIEPILKTWENIQPITSVNISNVDM